jgi:predicted alpha/beta-hydrolase family hydrolase
MSKQGESEHVRMQLKTPRGAIIEILQDRPRLAGRLPVVVLAGGTFYNVRQPIFESLAEALTDAGIGVIRVEWAYRVKDPQCKQHSPDRAAEIEDLRAALAHARSLEWVDRQRLILGGKSLGSIVSWHIFRDEPELRAAVLLTPIGKPQEAGPRLLGDNYPEAAQEKRPSLWVLGDDDEVCTLPVLYRHLAGYAGRARTLVVGGDQDLEQRSQATNGRIADTSRSIKLLGAVATSFVTELAGS